MGPKRNIYAIYASQDKDLAHNLLRNFQLLEKDFNVSIWHDRPIYPNQQWKPQNIARLHEADIFLLLVSNAFMYSEFIQQDEFKMIIDKYKEDKATVIPILLDNCPWDVEFNSDDYDFSFKELSVLPEDRNPMRNWDVLDNAVHHVTGKVKLLIASSEEESDPDLPNENLEKEESGPLKQTQATLNLVEDGKADSAAKKENGAKERGATKKIAEEEKKIQEDAETKRKALEEKERAEEAEAKIKAEQALNEKDAKDAKKRVADKKKLEEQAEAKRIAFEEKVIREKTEAKKIAEEERRIEEQAEAKRIAFEKRNQREEAEAKRKAEQKLKSNEAAQAKKKEEQESTLKVAAEAKIIAEEERRIEEQAEAKKKAELALKEKESVAVKKIALKEKQQEEEAETKRKQEQELKVREAAEVKTIALNEKRQKEEAEARDKEEQDLKIKEAADAKRKAVEEERLKKVAQAKKKVEMESWLEKDADIPNTGLKATRRERLNNIINNSEDNRPDETENSPLRKKVYIGLGIGALVIIGIWLFSLLGPSPEKTNSTLPEANTTANKDSVTTAKSNVDGVKDAASLSKLAVGDTYAGGLVFAIDPSGTSGKIAYVKDAGPMSWKRANTIHEQLGEGWRLATLDELRLMYRTIGQGAANSGQFADELYWSATPYDTYQARLLKFSNGNASYHYNKAVDSRKFLVRAVRDF